VDRRQRQPIATTILPPARLDFINRWASWISWKPNTLREQLRGCCAGGDALATARVVRIEDAAPVAHEVVEPPARPRQPLAVRRGIDLQHRGGVDFVTARGRAPGAPRDPSAARSIFCGSRRPVAQLLDARTA
jgi:hypothetical protein